jgi:hypothetical protein
MRKTAAWVLMCLAAAASDAAAESNSGSLNAMMQITRHTTYEQAAAAAVQMGIAAQAASALASLLNQKADSAQSDADRSAQLAQGALLSGASDFDSLQTKALEDQLAANRLWTDAEQATKLAEDARRAARAAELTAVNALNTAASVGPVSTAARAKLDRTIKNSSVSSQ